MGRLGLTPIGLPLKMVKAAGLYWPGQHSRAPNDNTWRGGARCCCRRRRRRHESIYILGGTPPFLRLSLSLSYIAHLFPSHRRPLQSSPLFRPSTLRPYNGPLTEFGKREANTNSQALSFNPPQPGPLQRTDIKLKQQLIYAFAQERAYRSLGGGLGFYELEIKSLNPRPLPPLLKARKGRGVLWGAGGGVCLVGQGY